jgi:ribosomal protein S18 acetylase RimI-like enzyme
MKIQVRPATDDDADVLARMLTAFDGYPLTSGHVAARMQACRAFLTTFLGEVDGQVAGFACLRLLPQLQEDLPYAEVTDIYVDPAFRRRGVARALLEHIDGVAQAAGAPNIILLTDFDNETAQATYRACGYANWALAMKKRYTDDSR